MEEMKEISGLIRGYVLSRERSDVKDVVSYLLGVGYEHRGVEDLRKIVKKGLENMQSDKLVVLEGEQCRTVS